MIWMCPRLKEKFFPALRIMSVIIIFCEILAMIFSELNMQGLEVS